MSSGATECIRPTRIADMGPFCFWSRDEVIGVVADDPAHVRIEKACRARDYLYAIEVVDSLGNPARLS